jgi:hypothetical protein
MIISIGICINFVASVYLGTQDTYETYTIYGTMPWWAKIIYYLQLTVDFMKVNFANLVHNIFVVKRHEAESSVAIGYLNRPQNWLPYAHAYDVNAYKG